MCVYLCVSVWALSQLNGLTVTKFGTGIDLKEIPEEFTGQGHRSKVQVIQLKNVILKFGSGHFVLYLISEYKGFEQ